MSNLCESEFKKGVTFYIVVELREMTVGQIAERDKYHTQYVLDIYQKREKYENNIKYY